jgi:hypothetical protein
MAMEETKSIGIAREKLLKELRNTLILYNIS